MILGALSSGPVLIWGRGNHSVQGFGSVWCVFPVCPHGEGRAIKHFGDCLVFCLLSSTRGEASLVPCLCYCFPCGCAAFIFFSWPLIHFLPWAAGYQLRSDQDLLGTDSVPFQHLCQLFNPLPLTLTSLESQRVVWQSEERGEEGSRWRQRVGSFDSS